MTGIWEAIASFFKAFTAGAEAAKTYAPTDAMKESKFEREIPRKTIDEKTKILNKATAELRLHPRQSVDAYVAIAFDDILNPEDVEELRTGLYERFPKRKHIKQ